MHPLMPLLDDPRHLGDRLAQAALLYGAADVGLLGVLYKVEQLEHSSLLFQLCLGELPVFGQA
jgi:hypothetical protein